MRLFVKYDRNGTILSVAKMEVMPEEMKHPFEYDSEALVIEVPMETELEALECSEIHKGYAVNIEEKTLRQLA